ncbi:MAG: hypothetical protein D6734_07735 [Candidatus Schekmanbacteria bacterium]|nr:MAG: hypothetical protein D6734_07735 [Candidatus Schekmanbacteria bacterium]
MKDLREVHSISFNDIKNKISLSEVSMKYPLPWRPIRALGMIRFTGRSYTSERFHRILIMKTKMFRGEVCTVFICPKPEYRMPIFESETMFFGRKTIFFMDVMQTWSYDLEKFSGYDNLLKIRSKYSNELADVIKPKGKIAEIFSPSLCYANIRRESELKILDLHKEYLDVYIESVSSAEKLRDETLILKAEKDFENFIKFTTDNDPAMKILYKLYGEKEGRKRSYDLFYGK